MTECSVDFYLGASSHPAAAPFQAAKTDTHAAIMTLLRSTRSFACARGATVTSGSAETNNLTQCHPSLNEEEAHAFQPNAERRRVYLYPKSNSNATFFFLTAEAECAFKTDNLDDNPPARQVPNTLSNLSISRKGRNLWLLDIGSKRSSLSGRNGKRRVDHHHRLGNVSPSK